jgi:hypothetical protein
VTLELWLAVGLVAALLVATVVLVVALVLASRASRAATNAATAPSGALSLILLGIPLAVLSFVAIGVLDLGTAARAAEVQLPLLLTGGVVALLLALVATTVAFAQLQLTDMTEALGLPRGSIRAVIALGLILIFAIMSIYIFNRFAVPTVSTLPNLTQEQVDSIPGREIFAVIPISTPPPAATGTPGPTVPPRFNVQRERVISETGEHIAQQVVTTVGTLVVAVSAFYFGATSVNAARAAIQGEAYVLVAGPPVRRLRKKDGGWVPEEITVMTFPRGLSTSGSVEGDDSGTLTYLGDDTYRYEASDKAQAKVTLKFALLSRPEITSQVVVEKGTE